MKRDAFLDALPALTKIGLASHLALSQFSLDLGHELIIDNFAGGGGTSEGLEQAFGRPVDIAINHDPEALAMHALNHPRTLHLCESVWNVDPIQVTGNRPVALVWLSPDCKHFSKAKGGTPVSKNIRGLAWVGLRWVALTKPRALIFVGEDGKAYPDPKKKGKTPISAAFMTKFRTGSVGHDLREPTHTITANSFVKRPGGTVPMGLVAACLEQANGGYYDGEGRPLQAPISTILGKGANQRLITAYCVRIDTEVPQPTARRPKGGKKKHVVQMVEVCADALTPQQLVRAKQCADLLHHYLPEHFPEAADLVLVGEYVLLDVTLRMLKPRELFRAQAFPERYIIEEIPDPAILFKDGVQAANPLTVPRIPLSATAQVRMCGNSVSPVMAKALVHWNFAHEHLIYGRQAA